MTQVLISAALAAAGYAAGRVRPGRVLFNWAEDRDRGSHGPGWWAAQAVGLAAVVWVLAVHPRRPPANRRSWKEARTQQRSPAVGIPRHTPAPQLDPDWVANRSAVTTPKEGRPS